MQSVAATENVERQNQSKHIKAYGLHIKPRAVCALFKDIEANQ
jgi:hypothetical protein